MKRPHWISLLMISVGLLVRCSTKEISSDGDEGDEEDKREGSVLFAVGRAQVRYDSQDEGVLRTVFDVTSDLNDVLWYQGVVVSPHSRAQKSDRTQPFGVSNHGYLPDYFVPLINHGNSGYNVESRTWWEGGQKRLRSMVTFTPAPLTPVTLNLQIVVAATNAFEYNRQDVILPAYDGSPISARTNSIADFKLIKAPSKVITYNPAVGLSREKFKTVVRTGGQHRAPILAHIDRDGVYRFDSASDLNDLLVIRVSQDGNVLDIRVNFPRYIYHDELGNYGILISNQNRQESLIVYFSLMSSGSASPFAEDPVFHVKPCDSRGNGSREILFARGRPNCVMCRLKAYPHPTLALYKNRRPLSRDDVIAMGGLLVERRLGVDQVELTLLVDDPDDRIMGSYMCHGDFDGIIRRKYFNIKILVED